jgi:hypothetical protein
VSGNQEEPFRELGRELGRRPRQRDGAGHVVPQRDLRRAGKKRVVRVGSARLRVGRRLGGQPVELGDVVHDPVELVHETREVLVADRQLGQPRHVEHVLAADAHALSHSRSSPA